MPPNLEYIISQLSQIFAQQVPFRGFMDIVNAPSKAVTAAIATKKNDLQGYQLLLDADSVNVEAKIWSGIMCTLLGEYDLAEKILQQSLVAIMNEYNANKPDRDKLKLYQHSLLVNEFLGASYQKLGQLSLAITHFNRAFNDVLEVMGDINIVCAREVTKKFEEVRREKVSKAIEHFSKGRILGEFIIMFNPKNS